MLIENQFLFVLDVNRVPGLRQASSKQSSSRQASSRQASSRQDSSRQASSTPKAVYDLFDGDTRQACLGNGDTRQACLGDGDPRQACLGDGDTRQVCLGNGVCFRRYEPLRRQSAHIYKTDLRVARTKKGSVVPDWCDWFSHVYHNFVFKSIFWIPESFFCISNKYWISKKWKTDLFFDPSQRISP